MEKERVLSGYSVSIQCRTQLRLAPVLLNGQNVKQQHFDKKFDV